MLTVHHLNHSRSQRILWLLEELDVDYQIVHYYRNKETMLAPDALKKIHPLGKAPTIVHDGYTLVESGAIIEYICSHFDPGHTLYPTDEQARWEAIKWLHYAEGSMMSPILFRLVFNGVREAKAPFFVKPIIATIINKIDERFLNEQIKLHVDYLFQSIENKDFFVAEKLTIADIAMIFPLECIAAKNAFGLLDPRISKTFEDYVRRIQNRPAYQRALEKGGDYDYLLN